MILNVDPQLSQWDAGRSVSISEDSKATHIHFANQGDSKAVIIEIVDGTAKIPDFLLHTGKTVIAYEVLNGVTLGSRSFPVRKREKPESYIYEEDHRNYIYELISNAETAVADATWASENAKIAATTANLASTKANEATISASVASESANLAAQNANEAAFKASNTAKSLMVIGGARGANISLNDAIDQYLVGLRVFGKTTQDGTPTPDAPVELVSVGDDGNIGVIAAGKNLLQNTAVSAPNINGVSFTVNGDCSVTVKGTATADTYFVVNESAQIGSGDFYLTGCPLGGSATSYFLYISGLVQDFGNGVRSTLSGSKKIGICIKANTTVSNLTFYPMIRSVSVTDGTYEPYKGQSLTISTPNGLPGIPVTSGGNYTDANGQRWVCDEIDFTKGVYVQRVGSKVLTGEETYMDYIASTGGVSTYLTHLDLTPFICSHFSMGQTAKWANAGAILFYVAAAGCTTIDGFVAFVAEQYTNGTPITVAYILATPIETPLSEEELAAYASLHTYRNNTTVSNDAGAWMDLEYVMDAKKYIDSMLAGPISRISSVSLPASAWKGSDSLYSQVVTISGITPYSKVDLLPSVEQLAIFYNKDVAFVTENDNGVVTVYAIGDKPLLDYTMQVQITEVVV